MDRDSLVQFVVEMSKDPNRLRQLKQDPDKYMAAAGLTPEQIDAFKSLDPDRIRAVLTPPGFSPAASNIQVLIVAVIKF
jgi:hypothetical protein